MQSKKSDNFRYWIFFSAFFFFILRWYHPLVNFDEKIDISIIFESVSDGFYYFAPFKAIANFDLNYSYDPNINNLNNITAPFGALYLHLIFYSIFGAWSFVILELVYILIFLIIFYKISRLLSFPRLESLLIAVVLFSMPIFLELISLSGANYFNILYGEFYSLRFPRPLVSTIFFYRIIIATYMSYFFFIFIIG